MSISPPIKTIALLVVGVALVGGAIVVGQHWDLARTATLDFRGERKEGSAERIEPGEFRLRLTTDAGIHARTYRGGFGFQRPGEGKSPIMMAYNPDSPSEFQPAGISYVPVALCGAMFILGMGCVLSARRVAMAPLRKRQAELRNERAARKS